jgi:hypothetical protein
MPPKKVSRSCHYAGLVLTCAIQLNPDTDQHARQKAAENRLLAEARVLAARIHVPEVTVRTFGATSAFPQRSRPIPGPRSVYGLPQGLAAEAPLPPPLFANDTPQGFARPVPRPPPQLKSWLPSHPPPPPQPAYSRGPWIPRVEWVEEDPGNRILTTMPGTAAYYKRSYKFRMIKAGGEEQIPGEGKSSGTDKNACPEEPEVLFMIFGLTNVRRATSNRSADARTQLHNRRA